MIMRMRSRHIRKVKWIVDAYELGKERSELEGYRMCYRDVYKIANECKSLREFKRDLNELMI